MNQNTQLSLNSVFTMPDIMLEMSEFLDSKETFSLLVLSKQTHKIMQHIMTMGIFIVWNSNQLDVQHLTEIAGSRLPNLIHLIIGTRVRKLRGLTPDLTTPEVYTSSLLSLVCYFDVCGGVDDFCQGLCTEGEVREFLMFLIRYQCIDLVVDVIVCLMTRPYSSLVPTFDPYYDQFIGPLLNLYVLEYCCSVYHQDRIKHILIHRRGYLTPETLNAIRINSSCVIHDYRKRYDGLNVIQQRKMDVIIQGFEHVNLLTIGN